MKKSLSVFMLSSMLLGGCADMSYTAKGSIAGGVAGATLGALVGGDSTGVLIGAAGGALIGAGVGHYMDKQAQDLQKVLRPEIGRGEISVIQQGDHSITVRMTTNTSFNTNSAMVKAGFYPTLNKIAHVVNQYGKTKLVIVGHTDNTGSPRINQPLSESRARAVANYFLSKNVNPDRMSAYGKAEQQPIQSNATAEGRAANRRVEITIIPITG